MSECTSSTSSDQLCPICKTALSTSSTSTVLQKGRATLIEFSKLYGDTELTEYLMTGTNPLIVHQDCRRSYTSKRRYELKEKQLLDEHHSSESSRKTLRSTSMSFRWKEDCLFCSKPVHYDPFHPQRSNSSSARTLELKENVVRMADSRNDEWGLMVRGRLQSSGTHL